MVRRGIVMSAVVIVLTAAASASAGDVHYFAEGALGFFRTDIGLINPSTTDTAHVRLTYVTEDGQRVIQQVTLGPMQRQTVSVNEAMAGFGGGVSTIVESDRPIGADRFMEWGGSGYSQFETVQTEPSPFHGYPQSVTLTLPPLGAIVIGPKG